MPAIELEKILNLAIEHITYDTCEMLSLTADDNSPGGYDSIQVYEKKEGCNDVVGYFVYLPRTEGQWSDCLDQDMNSDLFHCLLFARDMGASMICFDRDVEPLPYLRLETEYA